MFETILLVVLVCIALALVGLVLIQQGKGADAGASFGGGASQTVFGGAGSGSFMTKSTWFLAAVFFVICVALAYYARERATGGAGIDFVEPKQEVVEVVESDVPQYADEAEAEAASDVPQPEAAAQDSEVASEASENGAETEAGADSDVPAEQPSEKSESTQ